MQVHGVRDSVQWAIYVTNPQRSSAGQIDSPRARLAGRSRPLTIRRRTNSFGATIATIAHTTTAGRKPPPIIEFHPALRASAKMTGI